MEPEAEKHHFQVRIQEWYLAKGKTGCKEFVYTSGMYAHNPANQTNLVPSPTPTMQLGTNLGHHAEKQ